MHNDYSNLLSANCMIGAILSNFECHLAESSNKSHSQVLLFIMTFFQDLRNNEGITSVPQVIWLVSNEILNF